MTVAELMEILATFPPECDIILAETDLFIDGGRLVVERAFIDDREQHAVPDPDGDFVVLYLTDSL